MSDLGKLNERIEALERAAVDLREQTSEARATLKDLRQVQKDIRHMLDTEAQEIVNYAIDTAVGKGLAEYADTIRGAQEQAVERVTREFGKLAKLYLEGDRKGDPSLHDLAMRSER